MSDAEIDAMTLPQLLDLHRVLGMGVAALQAAEKAGFKGTCALTCDEESAAVTLSVDGATA